MKTTHPVTYAVTPKNPEAHLLEVTCTVTHPDPSGQIFSLPAWIPGSYLIREYARHIVTLKAACNGKPLKTTKLDKHTWQCAPCRGALTLAYEVYAWDLSVRGAHLDTSHGFFNGTSVFLMAHGFEQEPHAVEIKPPPGRQYKEWRVATALPRDGAKEFGFGAYRAENYDELIDHPVEIGDFDLVSFRVRGVQHHVTITGVHDADLERLARDMKKICEYQIDFFHQDDKPPMSRYVFLVTAVGEGYGGLEHRASTALLCSRDDLPQKTHKEINDAYRNFLGLASHEYFHTWNVKRILPAAFQPYDLTKENYTSLLWVFEGLTSYYDDLVLARCGLISPEVYLQIIGETITKVLRTSGRLKQSVAESSFDAWTRFYRPDENSPNSGISYYAKGSLIGLALDLLIRRETKNRKSLDDVMRALWDYFGAKNIGVPEDGFEKLAQKVTGLSLKAFFDYAVRSRGDLPLQELLQDFGVDYELRGAESATDKGGKPASNPSRVRVTLGAKISGNKEAKVHQVYDGGAAQSAGLSADDCIIAVDGLRVNANSLEKILGRKSPGDIVVMLAFRRDELMAFDVTLQATPKDTCSLALRDKPSPKMLGLRKAWLGE
ncbi:MAG: PDZ domain-containing protein [Burkholderiales bacterium]